MAGAKKTKGIQTIHAKRYAQGQEWRPVRVSQKKMYGTGYKTFMGAQSIQSGELYRDPQGRVTPWHNIEFTVIKPEELK